MKKLSGLRVGRDRWAHRLEVVQANGAPSGHVLPRFILLAVGLLMANPIYASSLVTVSGRAMGTTWTVKFIQPSIPLPPATVERSVAERLEQLEQLFSTYRPQSALSRFYAARSTEWIPVAAELVQVACESGRISELTKGAFDVTVWPLVQLWGFGSRRRTGSIPTQSEIAGARARVDWRRLEVRTSPSALRKSEPGVGVDFSSMAKGFSADEVSHLLTRLGVPNHLVQLGGDVKAGGVGPEGGGWRVAIENPSEPPTSPAHVVALRDMALSTSGDYRNSFFMDGRRYGHIIDPRRGEPVSGTLAAVSVVHASCATSSAWATALFVLGADEGIRIAEMQGIASRVLQRDDATMSVQTTAQYNALRN